MLVPPPLGAIRHRRRRFRAAEPRTVPQAIASLHLSCSATDLLNFDLLHIMEHVDSVSTLKPQVVSKDFVQPARNS